MSTFTKYTIEITPLDTLFFRGGMPFSMGEDSWTQTSILPNPSVIWGALFSTLCANGLVDKNLEADRQKLKIKRFFLCDKENFNVYLPTPLDLCQEKGKLTKELKKTYYFKPNNNNIISNYPLDKIFMPTYPGEEELTSLDNTFIKISHLCNEYFRQDENLTIINSNEFQLADDKIGIKKDNTLGSAEEGNLYNAKFTQLKENWCFIIEFECAEKFPLNGVLRLGGEGKMAAFKKCEEHRILKKINKFQQVIEDKLNKSNNNVFKLYFHSPTFLEQGWFFKDEIFELYGAFVGKSLSIGGFDMLNNSPKKMLKSVPQGSVYYLKNNNNLSIEEIKCYLNNYLNVLNERGFGTFEILPIKKIIEK